MIKVAVTSQDGKSDFIWPDSEPWNSFSSELLRDPINLTTLAGKPDVVIFMNHSDELFEKYASKIPQSAKFLVLWESKVTRLENFRQNLNQSYSTIFSPSRLWIHGNSVEYFSWPQNIEMIDKVEMASRRPRINKMVLINSLKYSFVQGEQYSLRRIMANTFHNEIDVYGLGWNQGVINYFRFYSKFFRSLFELKKDIQFAQSPVNPFLKNYKGVVDSKEILGNYQVALIIENSLDYVSEKLFDALIHGVVPIYVGPELSCFSIPDEIAIQCSPNPEEIFMKFAKLVRDPIQVNELRQAGITFLNSDLGRRHDNRYVLKNLASRLREKILWG